MEKGGEERRERISVIHASSGEGGGGEKKKKKGKRGKICKGILLGRMHVALTRQIRGKAG